MTELVLGQDPDPKVTQALWALCDHANTEGKVLRLQHYRDSTGEVQDIEGRLIGLQGYVRLVEEAASKLPTVKAELRGKFPQDVIQQGYDEQVASYKATLDRYLKDVPFEKLPRFSEIEITSKGAGVRLKHFLMTRVNVVEPLDLKGAAKKASAMKTIVKARLRELGPLGSYKGQVLLEPGKVQAIKVLE